MKDKIFFRGKKAFLFVILSFFVLIFLFPFVNSHFVCGKVNDSNLMSASWFNVKIFYNSQENYGLCQISPEDNKFCCDVESIPENSWKIGDEVFAEIFEQSTGYFAGPVSVITTGDGYDVFPEMQLRKAIKIHSPIKLLFFSNTSEIFLNLSFEPPYVFSELNKENSTQILCVNCTNFSSTILADYGFNNWTIKSNFQDKSFIEQINFWVLKSFNFYKKFDCAFCRKNFIKSSSQVIVYFDLNLSSSINNVVLKEYVPIEFKILDSDAQIESYDSFYNVLSWNISGDNLYKNYSLKSPDILFFPKKYVFKTELGGQVLEEEEVIVYKFVKFFPSKKKIKYNSFSGKTFRVGPQKPLIFKDNKTNIEELVLIPRKNYDSATFNFEKFKKPKEIKNVLYSYKLVSNLGQKDISTLYFKLKMPLRRVFTFVPQQVIAYTYDSEQNKWVGKVMKKYKQDKNYFYYEAYLNSSNKIVIQGNQKKFYFIYKPN